MIMAWACLVLGISTGTTRAFVAADADAIFDAYNHAFYVADGAKGSYKLSTAEGTVDRHNTGFWTLANEIEMVEDVFDRTKSATTRALLTSLCKGFVDKYGKDWTANPFNDDIEWACIAFSRAFLITRDNTFLDCAKTNFDAVWTRGWSTALGGGIFWRTDNASKNACSNGPAAIASCYLYQIRGDTAYLTKAQQIYAWERATLFNGLTGAVYDNIRLDGGVKKEWVFSYNLGTFIGAANALYGATKTRSYYQDALLVTSYTKNVLCGAAGLFPRARDDGNDGASFNGVCVRWTARFVNDQHLWRDFYPWLKSNAEAAWKVRRSADNLSWCDWTAPTADDTRFSSGCFGSVVALQVVPSNQPSF